MNIIMDIFFAALSAIATIFSAIAACSANRIAKRSQLENEKNELILKLIHDKVIYFLPLEIDKFLTISTKDNLESLDDLLLSILEVSTIFKFTNEKNFSEIKECITSIQDNAMLYQCSSVEDKRKINLNIRVSIKQLLKIFYNNLFDKT